MARLTVNEAGTSGYTDELILTPADFTTAAGNTTTVVNFPVKAGDLIDACALVVTEAFSTSSNITIGPDSTSNGGSADADGFIEADITVQTCWDSDRLDLGRVGIKPMADKLCTKVAKKNEVIEAAHRRSINV